jgi:aquaporin TIP
MKMPKMDMSTEGLMEPAMLKAALAELIATGLFVFVGVGSVVLAVNGLGAGVAGVAFTHGLAILALTAAIAGISGGHINPAVSFAMFITGRIGVGRGAIYIVAQLLGAVIGALLLRLFIMDAALKAVPGAGGQAINHDLLTNLGGLGVEVVLTFVLVWTIFATAVNPRGLAILAPIAIGFAYLLDQFVGIPLTGASMNPARSFGPALALPPADNGIPGRWDNQWIYWIGPLLGAALAALSYTALYLTQGDDETYAPQDT